MKKNRLLSVILSIVMVLVLVIPVFAQDAVEPTEEPEMEESGSLLKFSDHPIVQMMAQFFASFFNPPDLLEPTEGEPPEEGEGEGGGEGEGEPLEGGGALEGDEPEAALIVPEEKIASMHKEDKLGFGVITKLLDVARMAQVTCSETGEFCDVTLESLMEEYKAGMSIGALSDKYGKPEHVGVGQLRKELEPKEKTNNGKVKD